MQATVKTLRSFFERESGLVIYLVALAALMEIGSAFGIMAGLGATLGLIALTIGLQVLAIRYRKPERYRAGPKPHWSRLKSEKEAVQAEDIRNIVLSVIPLVVFMPFVALAASLDSIARFFVG